MPWYHYWLSILRNAGLVWLKENAFSLSGSLAFYTLFSLAPTFIIALTVIGFVLGEQAAHGQIVAQLQGTMGPDAAGLIERAVSQSRVQESGIFPSLMGIVVLLVGATTVFAQMQHSLNTIWGVVAKPSRNSLVLLLKTRLFSLTIVLAIGFIMLVSVVASVALKAVLKFTADFIPFVQTLLGGAEFAVSMLVIVLLFGTIYKVLPDVKLKWKDLWVGTLVTALLFSFGRYGIAAYLAYTATASTYGAAGSVVLILLWVYYSSLILLFGAAFIKCHMQARGEPIVPRNTAVLVDKQIVEHVERTQSGRHG